MTLDDVDVARTSVVNRNPAALLEPHPPDHPVHGPVVTSDESLHLFHSERGETGEDLLTQLRAQTGRGSWPDPHEHPFRLGQLLRLLRVGRGLEESTKYPRTQETWDDGQGGGDPVSQEEPSSESRRGNNSGGIPDDLSVPLGHDRHGVPGFDLRAEKTSKEALS